MSDDPEYPVGYKNPPRHTRFQPGRSGNPSGRPRKKTNFTFCEALDNDLDKMVNLKDKKTGESRRMRKRNAIVHQLTAKAMSGDVNSIKLVVEMAQPRESGAKLLPPILEYFLERNATHESENRQATQEKGEGAE